MDFHSKTVKETAKILGTSLTKGLEPTEVVNRLNVILPWLPSLAVTVMT